MSTCSRAAFPNIPRTSPGHVQHATQSRSTSSRTICARFPPGAPSLLTEFQEHRHHEHHSTIGGLAQSSVEVGENCINNWFVVEMVTLTNCQTRHLLTSSASQCSMALHVRLPQAGKCCDGSSAPDHFAAICSRCSERRALFCTSGSQRAPRISNPVVQEPLPKVCQALLATLPEQHVCHHEAALNLNNLRPFQPFCHVTGHLVVSLKSFISACVRRSTLHFHSQIHLAFLFDTAISSIRETAD